MKYRLKALVRLLAVFVFLVSAMSLMTACGGGGVSSYDNPDEEYPDFDTFN
ncbi:hypothetical protein DSN97_01860 [Deferribacteraceae bacterium V6Fe1]|nr:hypothetical protein DSN97_01860 [Deferribacteraceae bacterium V6Fe1]